MTAEATPELVARLVRRDREAQALPAQITDDAALERVAAIIASSLRDHRKTAA